MADVFISYAREDSDIARRLAHLFECEDWSCWWDPKIALGDDFRPIVAEQIDAASAVVVLWSPAARASTWVRWESDRGRRAGKLVELALAGPDQLVGGLKDGALLVPHHVHIPPVRDDVLRRVAQTSNLVRRCDGWNSRLRATAWRARPPKHPIVAWEWVSPIGGWKPDGDNPDARLVRRERWVDTAQVDYGTTIGNYWLFGHEEKTVSIGWILIAAPEHSILLPKPNHRAERRQHPFTVPFNVGVRLAEMLDMSWPGGGVDLAEG